MPVSIFKAVPFLAAAALVAAVSSARANDYYISDSGTGNGSSAANAASYAFFNAANNGGPLNWSKTPGTAGKISPGDTVHLVGTITHPLSVNGAGAGGLGSGAAGNPITILFEPNAAMSSPAWPLSGAISLNQVNYIIVDGGSNGLIQNTANGSNLPLQQDSVGVNADDCHFFTVQNLTVANIYVHAPGADLNSYGTAIQDVGENTGLIVNFRVTNCIIHDACSGIWSDYGAPGCANYEFSFNTIYNCNWGGGCGDRDAAAVLSNLLVHDNLIYNFSNWDDNADENHHNGFYAFAENGGSLKSVSFYNNTFGPAFGVHTTAAVFCSGPSFVGPILIYNNVFLENPGESPDDGFINVTVGSGSLARIYNNDFFGGGTGNAIAAGSASAGPQTVDIRNNLVSGTGTFIAEIYDAAVSLTSDYNDVINMPVASQIFSSGSGYSADFASLARWRSGTGQDQHSVTGSPNLNGSWVPQPPSAAIDAGTSTAADSSPLSSYFTTDKIGTFRPQGAGWDIGALEYPSGPGAVNPVVPGAPVSGGPPNPALAIVMPVAPSTPVITSASTAACTVNTPFAYTIAATNSPTSFSAVGLPGGLSINPATGAITGTPAAAGATNVTISANNGSGTGSTPLLLIVDQANVAGVYFGTFSNGGDWALYVSSDNTGAFIAYAGGVSTVQNVTVNSDGSFNLPTVSISGIISKGGVTGFAGSLALIGSQDTGTSQAGLAGFYPGAALFGASGNTSAVVGGDGRILAVVSGGSPDAVRGTLSSGGTLNAPTVNSGVITITINTLGQVSASVTSEGATVATTYSGLSSGVPSTARLANLSARATAGQGSNALIAGFAVSGAAKTILVRGIGPGLAAFGVPGTLADPQLSVTGGDGVNMVDYSNDSWGGAPALEAAFVQTGAFDLAPTSADAALLDSFSPGVYTGVVTGANNGSGVALVELYDADTGPAPAGQLSDISARAQVGAGINALAAGFVIAGNAPETVLIRAIGPGLAQFGVTGVLANPQLDLYQGSTDLLENVGWGGGSALSAAFAAVGAFSLDPASSDSALVVTLPPGAYTAVVSGVNNATGVALVEVYELP